MKESEYEIEPGYEEEFEVRDTRARCRYFIDNEFFDHYSRMVGRTALAVYNGLCRYADKNGEAYPAQQSLAEKIGVERAAVNKAISRLVLYNIIRVTRRGKKKTNVYHLIDKKYWKPFEDE